jgi:hypothetical protein
MCSRHFMNTVMKADAPHASHTRGPYVVLLLVGKEPLQDDGTNGRLVRECFDAHDSGGGIDVVQQQQRVQFERQQVFAIRFVLAASFQKGPARAVFAPIIPYDAEVKLMRTVALDKRQGSTRALRFENLGRTTVGDFEHGYGSVDHVRS